MSAGVFVGREMVRSFVNVGERPTRKKSRSRRYNQHISPEVKVWLQETSDILSMELSKRNLPTRTIHWLGSREVCAVGKQVLNNLFYRHYDVTLQIQPQRFTPVGLLAHLREVEGEETFIVEDEDLIPHLIQPIRSQLGDEGLTCNFVGLRHQRVEAIYEYAIDLKGEEVFCTRWVNPLPPDQVRRGKFHRPVRLM